VQPVAAKVTQKMIVQALCLLLAFMLVISL